MFIPSTSDVSRMNTHFRMCERNTLFVMKDTDDKRDGDFELRSSNNEMARRIHSNLGLLEG